MNAFLNYTRLLGAATIAATMILSACSDTGDGTNDGGPGQQDSDNNGSDDTDTGDSDGNTDSGGDTGTEESGPPFVASCGNQVRSGGTYEYTVCGEYFFEANETLEQDSQSSCSIVGGTWSEERCPSVGAAGKCTAVGDATIVSFYYDLPESEVPARQNTCEGLGNTWTAL